MFVETKIKDMENQIKKLYKGSIKNKKFLSAIYEADGDEKPGVFADNNMKVLFASVYYGWLVSEYGVAWELHI